MEEKTSFRRAIKQRLERLSANDRRVESQIIVRELRKLLPVAPAHIALYSPYLDEPDITPLIDELLKQKNVICMGKVEANHMVMHQIRSRSDVHRNPVTNILEPKDDAPIDESIVAAAIIPGRAFTKECARMGRGNGGYDRWIRAQRQRNPKTTFIGVCFDCQIVDHLPTEPHDERVDIVLTAAKKYVR